MKLINTWTLGFVLLKEIIYIFIYYNLIELIILYILI